MQPIVWYGLRCADDFHYNTISYTKAATLITGGGANTGGILIGATALVLSGLTE